MRQAGRLVVCLQDGVIVSSVSAAVVFMAFELAKVLQVVDVIDAVAACAPVAEVNGIVCSPVARLAVSEAIENITELVSIVYFDAFQILQQIKRNLTLENKVVLMAG